VGAGHVRQIIGGERRDRWWQEPIQTAAFAILKAGFQPPRLRIYHYAGTGPRFYTPTELVRAACPGCPRPSIAQVASSDME